MGFLLLAAAGALLWVGAELFTDNAVDAARRLGITALAIGLVLAGAEPEELITAVSAAVRHRPGIAAGDAFGANVTMLTMILGGAALLRGVPVGGRVRSYALGASILGALAAGFAANGAVSSREGLILVVLYAAAVAAVWIRERQAPAIGEMAEMLEEEAEAERDADTTRRSLAVAEARAVGLALLGIAIMASGGWLAVLGAERIVEQLGQTDSAIGLTFVALATTAELIALLWAAARRDLEELAVAGIIGSVAYNATVTLGVAALVRPLDTDGIVVAAWAAALLPAVAILLGGSRHRIGRAGGGILAAGYAAYVVLLLT